MGLGSSIKSIFNSGSKINLPPPPDLSFLKDYSNFDFLKKPVGSGVQNNTDQLFQDLISRIGAPSSVDEATRGIEGEQLQQLLSGIDEDTNQAISGVRQDALDRGLGGPGMGSDIEQAGIGQAAATGAETKAGARTQYQLADLNRLKERESAVNNAYNTRYLQGADLYKTLLGLQTGRDESYANLLNSRDLARATGQSSAYGTQVQGALNNYTPSIFDEILRNIQVNVSPKGAAITPKGT